MFGQNFDLSLVEATFWLLKVLLIIALIALVASIVTLPLFMFALFLVNTWFWASEESQNAPAEGKKFRRTCALILRPLIPVVSILATLFLGSYFFGGSGASGDSSNPKTAPWGKQQFDAVTRSIAEKMVPPAPTPDAGSEPAEDAGTVEDPAKGPMLALRALSMIGLLLIGPFPTFVVLLSQFLGKMGLVLIIRSLSRNFLRTALIYLAIFVLVIVVTLIWSVLGFLDAVTTEKQSNLKAIITERNQIPSQMKPSHEAELRAMIAELPEKYRPKNGEKDIMTWAFVGGSLDPKNRTPQNSLFLFCMEPSKVLTMMDGLEDLTGEERKLLQKALDKMDEDKTACVLGKDRLKQIGKKVGDTIELTSFNYTDIVFRLKIIGVFPEGRYDQSAVMNRQYLKDQLLAYQGEKGKDHPLADKSLNLIWVRMPNKEAFEVLAEKVNSSGKFNPAVKMETASSAIGSFIEPMKDLITGMRYLVAPALLVIMSLVISNAISISVRERRTEMAVLKVLGFRPWMVMCLVLGEAALVGSLSGFMATATAFSGINAIGGVPFPVAFFPKFFIPAAALWWGPVIGAGTAILGSLLPALSAQSVKVSEVFSKVA